LSRIAIVWARGRKRKTVRATKDSTIFTIGVRGAWRGLATGARSGTRKLASVKCGMLRPMSRRSKKKHRK
jgi:hypothetical protein